MQRHVPPQPVDEDAGDPGAFLRLAGLALDDAGQHQRLPRGGERQALGACGPGLGQRAGHRLLRTAEDGGARLAMGIGVGLRQHRPLGDCRRLARKRLGAVQQCGDLARQQALGDGEAALHRAPLAQDREHVRKARPGGDGEFGAADRSLAARDPGREREGARVLDNAVAFEDLRRRRDPAARHHDLHGCRERAGALVGVHCARNGDAAKRDGQQ